MRQYPDLLTPDEKKEILKEAEELWRALESNELGGFSGVNRPFYILHAFKEVIEKYGKRDVGLSWSQNDLESAKPTSVDGLVRSYSGQEGNSGGRDTPGTG